MDATTRKALTSDLSRLTTDIAAALRPVMLAAGPVRTRAQRLWADERVGDPFDVWTDLLSRRAAVLWVLKSLYVRVLEDRGLLRPSRIVDPEGQALFAHLARDLGDTAYLRWVYRDLASANGACPSSSRPSRPSWCSRPTRSRRSSSSSGGSATWRPGSCSIASIRSTSMGG